MKSQTISQQRLNLAAFLIGLLAIWGGKAEAIPVYGPESFEGLAPDLSKWSTTGPSPVGIDSTPGTLGHPTDQFLGREGDGLNFGFSTEIVSLSLAALPAHSVVTVSFDLYVIQSWDGNGENGFGPDFWDLSVSGGPTLLNTTFSNVGVTQSFPGNFASSNPDRTGAAENNTLGYGFIGDSVYHLVFTFPHSADSLTLNFSASGLQGISDESWGLDNVTVNVTDNVACTDNLQCGPLEFCQKPLGLCGGIGICVPQPDICPDVFEPVCGCDGITYGNECLAEQSGVSVDHEGRCERQVSIDIKPGSDPNAFNCGSRGVLPVAILTTPDFDATTVDPSTVTLEAVVDTIVARKSVIVDADGDGDLDLVVYFADPEVAEEIGCPLPKNTEVPVTIRGATFDGVSVFGSDVLRIVSKERAD